MPMSLDDVERGTLISGRTESMAYPKDRLGFLPKLQLYLRQNRKHLLVFLVIVLFLFNLMNSDSASSGEISFAGAMKPGYFSVEKSVAGSNTFHFAAVTDLDQLSFMDKERKPTYRSILLPGTITHDDATNKYSIQMDQDKTRELKTGHNEAGRGAEFSELQIFNNRLLTFDDRTGDVFEILNHDDGKSSFVVPRFVLTEGEGDTDKGMKWEWATVKDGELWMGSMGKEYTNKDGSIANKNNLWVSIMNARGEIRRIDWSSAFNFVRHHLGADSPGYLIHESINWSSHLNRWVFAPRRISTEAYDDVKDEQRGSNRLVLVNKDFTSAETVHVEMKSKDGLHGFSSLAFIPGTKDRHAMALRSVEEDCAGDDLNVCKQRSYFVIFDVVTGEVLMDEVKIPLDMKFEGVEFVDITTVPP